MADEPLQAAESADAAPEPVEPQPDWIEDAKPLREVQRQLRDYFAGKRTTFDLPLAARGTPFQRKVWRQLSRIPFGKEGSYLDALRGQDGAPSPAFERVSRRIADTPTLKDAVRTWLGRTPIQGSAPEDTDDARAVQAWTDAYYRGHEQLHERALQYAVRAQALAPEDEARLRGRYEGQLRGARRHLAAEDAPEEQRAFLQRLRAAILFVDSNRELPLLSWPGAIIDGLIACEQAMLAFRQRHARMVERVIGRRTGTGGSSGVDYLDQTALAYRVFGDLWEVRTHQIRHAANPPLENPGFYGFLNA